MADQRWQVEVDSATCIGSGMCVSLAPAHFRLVDGQSEPVNADVAPDEDVLAAGDTCPVEAIRVRNLRTGEVLAPSE